VINPLARIGIPNNLGIRIQNMGRGDLPMVCTRHSYRERIGIVRILDQKHRIVNGCYLYEGGDIPMTDLHEQTRTRSTNKGRGSMPRV
jgi:hypothetical protein